MDWVFDMPKTMNKPTKGLKITMNNYSTVVLPLDIKCKIYVGIESQFSFIGSINAAL